MRSDAAFFPLQEAGKNVLQRWGTIQKLQLDAQIVNTKTIRVARDPQDLSCPLFVRYAVVEGCAAYVN